MASYRRVSAAHPAWRSEVTQETSMLVSTFLSGLAVLAVSIEMPVTAAVFGALAFCLVGHGRGFYGSLFVTRVPNYPRPHPPTSKSELKGGGPPPSLRQRCLVWPNPRGAVVIAVTFTNTEPMRPREHQKGLVKGVVILAAWFGMSSQSFAEWQMEQVTDRMTDEVKFALTPAREPSSGVHAELQIACSEAVPKVFPASLYVAVQLTEKMPEGATISWRIDGQPIRYQPMPQVHSTSRSALHELAPEALRQAKRVRLEWVASNGTVLFYEFDVTGAGEAIAHIPCGNSKGK